MKVLEETKWKAKIKCTGHGNKASGCGSLLEITKDDVRWYRGKSGDPSVDGTFFYAPEAATIKCPVCGCMTDLGEETRPKDFKNCRPFSDGWEERNQPND